MSSFNNHHNQVPPLQELRYLEQDEDRCRTMVENKEQAVKNSVAKLKEYSDERSNTHQSIQDIKERIQTLQDQLQEETARDKALEERQTGEKERNGTLRSELRQSQRPLQLVLRQISDDALRSAREEMGRLIPRILS